MFNSNLVELAAVDTSLEDTNMDNQVNAEKIELDVLIDLAGEAAECESVTTETAITSEIEKNEKAAKERIANIQKIIEDRRKGILPQIYSEHTEEAKEQQLEDKKAIIGELEAAQDEVDKVSAEVHAAKLRVISKGEKQEYSVPATFEYACEVDDTAIVKRDRTEYVYMFKAKMRRTALATLDMCRVVYEAEKTLNDGEFDAFCRQINYKSNSSTIRKFSTIGKVYHRFVQYAEQLPAAWTSIYALTQISADDFEVCIKGGYAFNKLTGGEIGQLVKKTRNISDRVSPFKQDKKTFQFAVATVFFTKHIDDADFRLLQRAFDEIASRLPVKLVVKKEATEYFEKRRAQRYEKLKVEPNDVMVKPEKWDYGFAANQVNKGAQPELKLAA